MYRKAAEARMLALREADLDAGHRPPHQPRSEGCLRALAARHPNGRPFVHKVEDLALPVRKVTAKEAAEAQAQIDALVKKGDTSRRGAWFQATVDRYRTQGERADLHGRGPRPADRRRRDRHQSFELFQDYGVPDQGRSKAVQTFVIELTGGWGRYLATPRAIAGGGYSAVVQSNLVGPKAAKSSSTAPGIDRRDVGHSK